MILILWFTLGLVQSLKLKSWLVFMMIHTNFVDNFKPKGTLTTLKCVYMIKKNPYLYNVNPYLYNV